MPYELKTTTGKQPTRGDTLPMNFTISGWTGSPTFTKAWATFKLRDTDLDAAAVLQKVITSGFTLTAGTLTFTITLTATETALFTAGKTYLWDVQILSSVGTFTPVPDGTVQFQRGRTDATS